MAGCTLLFQAEKTMNLFKNIAKVINQWLVELSPSCKAAVRLQSENLDHKLSIRQRLGLRIHLLLCKWCRRYGQQIRFVNHAAHSHPDEIAETITQPLSKAAKERIKGKIRSNLE